MEKSNLTQKMRPFLTMTSRLWNGFTVVRVYNYSKSFDGESQISLKMLQESEVNEKLQFIHQNNLQCNFILKHTFLTWTFSLNLWLEPKWKGWTTIEIGNFSGINISNIKMHELYKNRGSFAVPLWCVT